MMINIFKFSILTIPVVPRKAVAEVSHGRQSEPTDGSKGGWSVGLSICPSIYLAIYLSSYLSIQLAIYLFIYLSVDLSI